MTIKAIMKYLNNTLISEWFRGTVWLSLSRTAVEIEYYYQL